ncbi:MAG: hypothetical protein ABSF08_13070 [Candidatus Cybelea sp.]
MSRGFRRRGAVTAVDGTACVVAMDDGAVAVDRGTVSVRNGTVTARHGAVTARLGTVAVERGSGYRRVTAVEKRR